MTARKDTYRLLGDRTPAYVSRETGAAELQVSPETWDKWVKAGHLPLPCTTLPSGSPRWRWEDVDRKLSGQKQPNDIGAAMAGAMNLGKIKGRRRATA